MTVTQNFPQGVALQVAAGLNVQVIPSNSHEFLIHTNDVAHGYDCSTDNIRMTKSRHKDELREGKHFITITEPSVTSSYGRRESDTYGGLQTKTTYWTKRGVVRLGFFLRTKRAKLFRDWAEDLIIDGPSGRKSITLRDDEQKVLELANKYLIKGDLKRIAQEMGVCHQHVSKVRLGQVRSERILAKLVLVASHNKKYGKVDMVGYNPELVDRFTNLLES